MTWRGYWQVARVGGDLTAEVQKELKDEMTLLWDMAQTHVRSPATVQFLG